MERLYFLHHGAQHNILVLVATSSMLMSGVTKHISVVVAIASVPRHILLLFFGNSLSSEILG